MATEREFPYAQFNFLVDIGAGTDGIKAGFQEVSGLSLDVTVAEYRAGNSKENSPLKVNTIHKLGDVTLKRGVIGATDLWKLVEEIRNGTQVRGKTVTIAMMDESHQNTVLTWKLMEARPIKYSGPSLSGKGTDVAIEEITIAYERLEVE